MLLQEDLDGWLAIGHDGGHPRQVIGQDSCDQGRKESRQGHDRKGILVRTNISARDVCKTEYVNGCRQGLKRPVLLN